MAVAPWLMGNYTADQIAHHLHHQLPPAETYYALGLLQQKGYVVGDEPPPACPTIALRAIGRVPTQPLADLLTQHGVTITPDPATADLTLALTDDYLRPALADLNQTMLAAQRPWLLVRPWGREIWLGPHIIPHQTGCWHCLATRLRGQRPTERYLQQRLNTAEPMAPAPPSTAAQEAIAWGLVWSMGIQNPPVGQLLTLDPHTLQVARHPVAARPQCPACGQPTWVAHNQQTPPAFAPTPKLAGQRGVPTAALLPQLEPLLSPLTGLVGQMHHQPSGPAHSYTAEANLALPLADVGRLRRMVRGRAGGKGATPAEARLGALAESIERYAGVWQGDEPTITAPLSDLEGAIHPHDLLHFSPRQYAERAAWNGRGSLYNHVPEPFAAEQPTAWSRVWEVATGRPRYIPTALAYYGREAPFGRADSNGCAAGATVAEAFVQGFCELVERDSVAMWWYNRARRPVVDVASFGHPYLEAVLAHHATLGRELWVLDVTADLGLPTFVAVSRQLAGPERIALGFGCHLEAATAVARAVAELHQLLPARPNRPPAMSQPPKHGGKTPPLPTNPIWPQTPSKP